MNRIFVFLAIFLIIFAVVLGAVWFITGRPQSNVGENQLSETELTKSSGEATPGNVAIDVTLVTEQNAGELGADSFDLNNEQVFYVQMNTHSVDITAFKMEKISSFAADGKKAKALKWESAMEGGGHHRSGFLVFERTDRTKRLQLTIKGIPNIAEREFNWSI